MDPGRFEELVEPLRAELHTHCYRMLGSAADADDAVQETMIRAWTAFDGFDDRGGSLRPWLYRIATNRCLTALERRTRRELPRDLSPGVAADEVAWLEPYPATALGWTEALDPADRSAVRESVELAFVAALQHLGAKQRAVLVLREVLGFSAAEVAGQLDVSVPSVNSALQRARAVVAERVPGPSQQVALRTLGEDGVRDVAGRYAAAWEAGDVDAIVGLLAADVRYSMPPVPQWVEGRDAVRAFLVDEPLRSRWRITVAAANAQLAVATWIDDGVRFRPSGLDVLDLGPDGTIVEVVSFLTADFPAYGLPIDPPATDDFSALAGLYGS